MKILHVINSLQIGGAENLMVNLLPRLNQKGVECDLLTFDGTKTPFRQQLDKSDVKVFDFKVGCKPYSLSNIVKLIPFLRKYDIVHTHNTAPQLFVAIASVLCSVVLVTTEHTTSNRRRDWKWYAPIDRWMYSRYKKVICISDKTESALCSSLAHFNPPTTIIYNGIDTNRFAKALPFNLKADTNHVALMQIAGFRYQKDQKTVIRSLKILPEYIHAYFVGDGVFKDECIELAQNIGVSERTHFLGARTDVPELIKAADIIVMSSHWEGFGLAAVEGMAASRPTIASDVDGLKEVVKDAGLLFKQGNESDLADKVLQLIEDKQLYEQVANQCFGRAQEYDISVMVDGYINVYNELSN